MYDWDDIDREAEREGLAILRAFRSRRPRRPQGVNKTDVRRVGVKIDILKDLVVTRDKKK